MNLYSSERPEVTPGRKALLLDGSAVPHFTLLPLDDGRMVSVTVWLREYESGEPYSYSAHTIQVLYHDLPKFFFNYFTDPELVLEHYFHWKAQAPKPRAVGPSKVTEAKVKEQIKEYLDLI